jgi:hypothetical protein
MADDVMEEEKDEYDKGKDPDQSGDYAGQAFYAAGWLL